MWKVEGRERAGKKKKKWSSWNKLNVMAKANRKGKPLHKRLLKSCLWTTQTPGGVCCLAVETHAPASGISAEQRKPNAFTSLQISANDERHRPGCRARLQLDVPSKRMPKCTLGDRCFFILLFFRSPRMFDAVKYLNWNITENIISFICWHKGRWLKNFSFNLIVYKALKVLDDLLIK